MLEVITKYWVQWLCGLIALGIAALARHWVKLERKEMKDKWEERAQKIKNEVTEKLVNEREEEYMSLHEEDIKIKADMEKLTQAMGNLNVGVLSIQGKQFRDSCLLLLEQDHVISVQEYEQFEEDYTAYKGLGGNHRGDALHDRVVEKFNKQL